MFWSVFEEEYLCVAVTDKVILKKKKPFLISVSFFWGGGGLREVNSLILCRKFGKFGSHVCRAQPGNYLSAASNLMTCRNSVCRGLHVHGELSTSKEWGQNLVRFPALPSIYLRDQMFQVLVPHVWQWNRWDLMRDCKHKEWWYFGNVAWIKQHFL